MSETTTTTTTTPILGSGIVSAIEKFWSTIAERHPELPANVVVVTGSGNEGRSLRRGHWATERWGTTEGERAHEMFVAGERIADGAKGVANTVIHEAVHAIIHARGDASGGTSRQGRYHTRKGFAKVAEELGLQAPAKAHPTLGFSDCTITDATVELYGEAIEELERELRAAIGAGTIASATPTAARTRRPPVRLECECHAADREVPAAIVEKFAGLVCADCGSELV